MPLYENRKCFSLQARLPAALQVKIEVNIWEHAFTCISVMEKFTAILLFEFLFSFCSLLIYAYVIDTHSYMYQFDILYFTVTGSKHLFGENKKIAPLASERLELCSLSLFVSLISEVCHHCCSCLMDCNDRLFCECKNSLSYLGSEASC